MSRRAGDNRHEKLDIEACTHPWAGHRGLQGCARGWLWAAAGGKTSLRETTRAQSNTL